MIRTTFRVSWMMMVLIVTSMCWLALGQEDENTCTVLKKHTGPVKALAFSSDGQILASGGDDRQICIWDVKTGQLIGTIACPAPVKALVFTPDDQILAALGRDIELLDKDGHLIRMYGGYTTDIWSLDFSVVTHLVIAGSYARSIRVWNYQDGTLKWTLSGPEKSCLSVALSPSGQLAASGSLDRSVRLWDMKTGKEIRTMNIHSGNIFAVRFHPSGLYLASASADKTIRLWDVKSGKLIRTFTGHDAGIFDICFSPDGNHLISGAADHSIYLWETATGRRLNSFEGHTGAVNIVRFSPDGKLFATASDDHTVRLWNLEKKDFLEPYFGGEIDKAIQASPLIGPKRSGESRQEFEDRKARGEKFLQDLYDRYYQQYVDTLKAKKIE